MNPNSGKKKFTLVIGLIISVVIIIAIILLGKFSFAPEHYERTSFSNEEYALISDNIYINPDKIEKISFSHAKDPLFVIYISGINKNDLDMNYTQVNAYSDEITYEAKENHNVKCILKKSDNQYTAEIKIMEYNKELYKMIKANKK